METSPTETRSKGILGSISPIILIATVAVDQISKGLVMLIMNPGQSIPDSGVFRLTYVTNTGSAFGLFPNQTTALVMASFIGIGVLLIFYRTQTARNAFLQVSLGLQLGGAIGNLVDRVRLGYVIDFLDVGIWPVFNLADSAIVLGLIGLMWAMASTKEESTPKSETREGIEPLSVASQDDGLHSDGLERAPAREESTTGRREKSWRQSEE